MTNDASPKRRLRVIPVIDLMNGVVVRGVGGRRGEYRPVVSQLTASTDPLGIADACRARFGLTHLYVADIDAIAGRDPAIDLFRRLRSRGFSLWVDAGIRHSFDAVPLFEAEVEGIVVGLETVAGPAALADTLHHIGADRVVFSLDLKGREPLGDRARWNHTDAFEVARQTIAMGVRKLIVLDLARVGEGSGTGTESLCRHLAETFPEVDLIAGGGVRDDADLRRLEAIGVRAALVASALHDGGVSAAIRTP